MAEIACCGCICDSCKEYKITCNGCNKEKGKPVWISQAKIEQCPFYICCVVEKHLPHCGKCEKLPCSLFYSFNDPAMTQSELDFWLNERITNLKNAL